MSCRFAEFSKHNLQLLMFGQTDAAEQERALGFAQALCPHSGQVNLVLLARFIFARSPAGADCQWS